MVRLSKILTYVACALLLAHCSSPSKESWQTTPDKSVYLLGASIAHPANTWFEMGCEELKLNPYNKATGGGRKIGNDAVAISQGEILTPSEHDDFDLLVIMHCHNAMVDDESMLLDDYHNYTLDVDMDYSQGFDYVIRTYIDQCRALEHNETSKWFGVEGGKPVKILLCTYWHDAREIYNSSIRRLDEKWGDYTYICPFDTEIGFSKDEPDPITGEQVSIQYAKNGIGDTEIICGETYGWHPTRGRDAEIQQRMAAIFASAVREIPGL